jgi:hypothetical protein
MVKLTFSTACQFVCDRSTLLMYAGALSNLHGIPAAQTFMIVRVIAQLAIYENDDALLRFLVDGADLPKIVYVSLRSLGMAFHLLWRCLLGKRRLGKRRRLGCRNKQSHSNTYTCDHRQHCASLEITGHAMFKHPYSTTSSARESSVGGIVNPSSLAVQRLILISNRDGCTTGISAGLAPFRISAALAPAWR